MCGDLVDAIDYPKAKKQQHTVLHQMSDCGSIAHYIDQVAAGTVNRQKGKQGKQGHQAPYSSISSNMSDNLFQLLQVFYRFFELITSVFIILEQVKTRAGRGQQYSITALCDFIGYFNRLGHGIGLNQ